MQPKQLDFMALARQCDDPNGPDEIGLGGARGGTKSFSVFSQVTLDDCQRCDGLKALHLRNTARGMSEQLEDLAYAVLRHYPGAEIKRNRIDFENGSRVIVGGYNDDRSAMAYLGLEYDIITVEEASRLSSKAHEHIRASNRSSKYANNGRPWRPRRYYTTNPLGVGHMFFKKRFVDNERARLLGKPYDPKHRFIFTTVDDNLFLNPEYAATLDEMTGVEYQAYRLGNWDVSAGAYFDQWNELIHVIPALTARDVEKTMIELWCSMDIGFQHWNAVQLHGRDRYGNTYTIDEMMHRQTHPPEVAADVLEWLDGYGLHISDLRVFTAGTDAFAEDSSAQQTTDEQYADAGIMLTPAEVGPGSRVGGAQLISRLLGNPEQGRPAIWACTEKCEYLKECLPFLEKNPNKPEDVLKVDANDSGVGGDDPYDCLRHGMYMPGLSTIS